MNCKRPRLKDSEICNLKNALIGRDTKISELAATLKSRDDKIVELKAQLDEIKAASISGTQLHTLLEETIEGLHLQLDKACDEIIEEKAYSEEKCQMMDDMSEIIDSKVATIAKNDIEIAKLLNTQIALSNCKFVIRDDGVGPTDLGIEEVGVFRIGDSLDKLKSRFNELPCQE